MAVVRASAKRRRESTSGTLQEAKRAKKATGNSRSVRRSETLTLSEYRKRLRDQGKYSSARPSSGCTACTARRSCVHDPPKLPPVDMRVSPQRQPLPKRGKDKTFLFQDHPEFRPNLSPAEVLQLGSFGGTYFRDIESAVVGQALKGRDVIKELPKNWFKGLDVPKQVCSPIHNRALNKYAVDCGVCLGQWETSGWISSLDPYGWFQWFCRFHLGRRSTDDCRQIGRFRRITGLRRGQLCNDILNARASWNDATVSPVLRQALQHWAYRITREDLEAHKKKKTKKKCNAEG